MISCHQKAQLCRRNIRLGHALFLILLYAVSNLLGVVENASAQTATATLSGRVEDQNGASIPKVSITIQNTATSVERQTTTSESGEFTVPLLPPGNYTVTGRHNGFTPIEVRNVILNVGDRKVLQIQLKAGSVSEMVQIDAGAP